MIHRQAGVDSGGAPLPKSEQSLPQRREKLVSFAVAMAALAVIILLEPTLFSLERGSHFSWVTLHSLSIVDHSRLASGFVGYSCKLGEIASDGAITFHYDYFNRYSVLFPLLSNLFLDFFRESTQLYLLATKQLMNLVYVLTLWVMYLTLRTMGFSRLTSILSIFSVGASPLWLHYRPMFHFDQPGLLGFVVCIYGYAAFIWQTEARGSSSRPVAFLLLSVSGCLFGRSFISVLFLVAISIFQQFKSTSVRLRVYCWLTTILGGALVVAAALYAGMMEAILNGDAGNPVAGLVQSSVLQSSFRRLGLPAAVWPDAQKPQLAISSLVSHLVEWLANLIPSWPVLLLLLLCIFLLIGRLRGRLRGRLPRSTSAVTAISSQRTDLSILRPVPTNREGMSANAILWSCFLASVAWLVLFRNLIVFHDYTVMFLVPFMAMAAACIYQAFFDQLLIWMPAARYRFVVCAMLSFIISIVYIDAYLDSVLAWRVSDEMDKPLATFYRDVDQFNFRSVSSQPWARVQLDRGWIEGSPYGQCVLLDADLVINPDDARSMITTPPVFPISVDSLRASTFRSKRKLAEGSLKQLFYRNDADYLR